jgi:DNA-binding CsgD family transcriptional regulator
MAQIPEADWQRILDVLSLAALGTSAEPLPQAALDALRGLVGCDTVAYFEGAPADRATRRRWISGDYVPWSEPERRLMDTIRYQNPLEPSPATRGRAVRVTDFMSRSAYQRLDLYQLLGRRHGIEFAMNYWCAGPDGRVRGFSFDASRRDFTDRERDMVDVLGPHLTRILGQFDPRLPPTARGLPITRRQAEILAWVARGLSNDEIAVMLSISPNTVRTHLEHTFKRLGVHRRAQAIALAHNGQVRREGIAADR